MADKYGVQVHSVTIDNEMFKTTPVPASGTAYPIFQVPNAPNMAVEVLNVCYSWGGVIPVDATDDVTLALNYHKQSDSSDTVLVAAQSIKSGATGVVLRETKSIFPAGPSSVQRMVSGDSLDALFVYVSPDTAGLGLTITTVYRVKEWNGE